MEDYSDYEMIKGGESKDTSNLTSLREEFITTYCMSRGWDVKGLTPEQLNEIRSQKQYKNPGIILS